MLRNFIIPPAKVTHLTCWWQDDDETFIVGKPFFPELLLSRPNHLSLFPFLCGCTSSDPLQCVFLTLQHQSIEGAHTGTKHYPSCRIHPWLSKSSCVGSHVSRLPSQRPSLVIRLVRGIWLALVPSTSSSNLFSSRPSVQSSLLVPSHAAPFPWISNRFSFICLWILKSTGNKFKISTSSFFNVLLSFNFTVVSIHCSIPGGMWHDVALCWYPDTHQHP